jgi:anti-sigma B factor antagonist
VKITQKNTRSGSKITIDGELTIYTVSEAKQHLLDNHEEIVEPIGLNLRKITELDAAGMQLLLYAKEIFNDHNKRIFIEKSNDHVDDILDFFAVTSEFTLNPKTVNS